MGNCLKLDCLRVDIKAIFQPISVILQAIFFSVIFRRLGVRYLLHWVGNILSWVILSLPLIQEGQLSVSGERMCTVLVNH